MHFLLSIYFHN